MSPTIAPSATVADGLHYSNTPAARALESTALPASAVSWGAIFSGAAAAAALSLIMLMLGSGLGFSVISPWSFEGISAKAFGLSAILWLSLTQIVASGIGGYIAGRLRTKWLDVQLDEVYFRDTAHGFLAWSVATLATAALLTTVIGAIVGGGVQAAAQVASGGAEGASQAALSERNATAMTYSVDSLFRRNMSAVGAAGRNAGTTEQVTPISEVSYIFLTRLPGGALPQEDLSYVAQRVAQHTGLSQADAEKRVRDTYTGLQKTLQESEANAKAAADKARKASAYVSLWLFISLLIGAFTASLSATCGGRCRDRA